MRADGSPRVLMLSTSYPVTKGSVSGLFVQSLAQSLAKTVSVSIVTPAAADRPKDDFFAVDVCQFRYAPREFQRLAHVAGGIPAQLRHNRGYLLLVPFFLFSYWLAVLWHARKADIIQANWAVSAVIGALAKWVYRIPLVTTLRGEDVRSSNGFLSQLILRSALVLSDRVVLVSDEMKADLVALYPSCADKCVVIHNGVELRGGARGPAFFASGALQLVYVGSLINRKNVACVLSALIELKLAGVDFVFRVLGAGAERESLELQTTAAGLADQVEFWGEVEPEVVSSCLAQSHVYISASLHEGRPNSVLEAMASGVCCVLSDISGHRELAGLDRGSLFSLNQPGELKDLLQGLDSNRHRLRATGERGLQYIESSGLTWDACADQYRRVFNALLN